MLGNGDLGQGGVTESALGEYWFLLCDPVFVEGDVGCRSILSKSIVAETGHRGLVWSRLLGMEVDVRTVSIQ